MAPDLPRRLPLAMAEDQCPKRPSRKLGQAVTEPIGRFLVTFRPFSFSKECKTQPVMPMAKLIFIDKDFSGQVYQLVLEKTTVGRGDQNNLVIHDNSISAAHCEILVYGPEVIVCDLNSRNGTFVNGVRLKNQQCQVKHGQTVRFGSVEGRLELEAAYDEEPTSEISAIYAHRRTLRDLRRAREQRKPTNPSKHLESAVHPVAEEQTVLLPAELLNAPPSTPSAPLNVEPGTEIQLKRKYVVIAVVVTLGLMVLLWLVWNWS